MLRVSGAALVVFAALAGCSGEPATNETSPGDGAGTGGTSGASGSTSDAGASGTTSGGTASSGGASSGGSAGSGSGGTSAGGGAGSPAGGGAGTGDDGGSSSGGSSGTDPGGSSGSPNGGGDGAGTGGTSAGSGGSPGGAGGSTALSFEADIWPIYNQVRDPAFVYPGAGAFSSCDTGGVCHGGSRPGAGLSMTDAETAYADLIDVPSTSSLCAGTIRVVPGNPEQSCLILFYEGRLRDELDWVDDTEIDLMRRWIAGGALP